MTSAELELNSARATRPSARWLIFVYLGALLVLIGFGQPYLGLMDIPVAFFLKNKLHLSAEGVATFRLYAGIPLYLSFVFGFLRDSFNPFGIKDRGFLIVFGALSTALYLVFAFVPFGYDSLLAAVLLLTMSFLFVLSAQSGLSAVIGRQLQMSGQVSAAWNTFSYVPILAGYFLGGYISNRLEADRAGVAVQHLFLLGAAVMAVITLFGFWRPARIFKRVHGEDGAMPRRRLSDIKRLLRHWPFYPAMAVWFLWSFAPGYQTPLQFYLQNTLHASDAAFADWNAIFAASFILPFLLFGVLARKFNLRQILFWSTLVAIPQAIPLYFTHSVSGALIAAGAMGLLGGVATGAYLALIIRSAPEGLEGTTVMMSVALYFVAVRFGDLLGTWLYHRFAGFGACILAITVVYVMIVPVLMTIPRRITDYRDEEKSVAA
ncbi:MAG: MFS transporter [Alphaproteobacteria bacterium]|nr:MFS transporter [Alphaproteobacteria bacterium]